MTKGSAPHDLMVELCEIGRRAFLVPQRFDPPLIGEPATMLLYGTGTIPANAVQIMAKFNNGQLLAVSAPTIEKALQKAHHRAAAGPQDGIA